MDMSTLDPATTQALAWVFGFLLFCVISTATGLLIKILSELLRSKNQHEIRLNNLEDDMEAVHGAVFQVRYPKSKK